MSFPTQRPRRLRQSENLRRLMRETYLHTDQLIMPYFVQESLKGKEEISSMPGQFRYSLQALPSELEALIELGIRHVLLFGIPAVKDVRASQAYDPQGIVQQTVEMIKKQFPELTVITDVCLCEYMSHGHCGMVEGEKVLNDETLELLVKTAVSHAKAGADVVAPSDMMDGRVGAIRKALDQNGFKDTALMSYAAKYASAFYGPFREAAHSTPQFGDRQSYQMDPANREEALREVALDIEEGADLVMVKPALAYLDVICDIKKTYHIPLAAYQVSGEYTMIKSAATAGFMDEKRLVMESVLAIRRAGATAILTYFAKDIARWLHEEVRRGSNLSTL